MFMLDLQAARYLVDGVVPKQVGNEHPTGVPTNAYKTKDGYVNIAPIPSMWGRLCKALGREDLIDHPDFATREVRRKRRREVNALIQSITAEMDTATLMREARSRRGAVRADLFDRGGLQRSAGQASRARPDRDRDRRHARSRCRASRSGSAARRARSAPHAGIRRAHRRDAGRVRISARPRSRHSASVAWWNKSRPVFRGGAGAWLSAPAPQGTVPRAMVGLASGRMLVHCGRRSTAGTRDL